MGKKAEMGARWERLARKVNEQKGGNSAIVTLEGKIRFMRTPRKLKDRSKYMPDGSLKRKNYGEGRR